MACPVTSVVGQLVHSFTLALLAISNARRCSGTPAFFTQLFFQRRAQNIVTIVYWRFIDCLATRWWCVPGAASLFPSRSIRFRLPNLVFSFPKNQNEREKDRSTVGRCTSMAFIFVAILSCPYLFFCIFIIALHDSSVP